MGQGLYTAIVFGAIEPPVEVADEQGYTDAAPWYETAVEEAENRRAVHFDSSYEAEPWYRGVTIAVSDKCLAKRWKVAEFNRVVLAPDDLLDWVTNHANPIHDRAIAAWEDIRASGREAGVEIPEGRLLLVNDWD